MKDIKPSLKVSNEEKIVKIMTSSYHISLHGDQTTLHCFLSHLIRIEREQNMHVERDVARGRFFFCSFFNQSVAVKKIHLRTQKKKKNKIYAVVDLITQNKTV
jgi:hypothetical protein